MTANRILPLLSGAVMVLVTSAAFWVLLRPRHEPPPVSDKGRMDTLALYMESGSDPRGIHVADIGFDAQGNAILLRASEPEVGREVQAALDEAQRLPALPLKSESQVNIDGKPASALEETAVRRGESGYPWALGGFVRARTGLRYDVVSTSARER